MSRSSHALGVGWVIGTLLVAGCLESPYAPAPTVTACGTEKIPCGLSCGSSCAATALSTSTACMMTLEGTLSASRMACDFADGSQAVFDTPLPPGKVDLSRRSWSIVLRRANKPCLTLSSDPLPWQGGPSPSRTMVTGPAGSVIEDVWGDTADGSARDRGLGALRQVRLRCPDGKHYAGGADQLCAGCDGSCVPLVTLRVVRGSTALEFRLEGGGQVTPLFTCAIP